MKWYVISISEVTREIISKYDTEEQANKKLKKLQKNNLNTRKEHKVISVPTISPGLILYKDDIPTHMVTDESKSLWFYNKIGDFNGICDCWSKERIALPFIYEIWDGKNETERDSRFIDNYYNPKDDVLSSMEFVPELIAE